MNKIDIKMDKEYICIECFGDGKEIIKTTSECKSCNGSGILLYENNLSNKLDIMSCLACKGTGKVYEWIVKSCSYCKGNGYRSWIDYILRPNQKEKEVCNV